MSRKRYVYLINWIYVFLIGLMFLLLELSLANHNIIFAAPPFFFFHVLRHFEFKMMLLSTVIMWMISEILLLRATSALPFILILPFIGYYYRWSNLPRLILLQAFLGALLTLAYTLYYLSVGNGIAPLFISITHSGRLIFYSILLGAVFFPMILWLGDLVWLKIEFPIQDSLHE